MAISIIGGTSSAGAAQQYQQIFTSSGTWNKPSGVKTCEVTVLGGGGTGMSGVQGGGGAGGYYKGIVDVTASSSFAVTVGAGAAWNTSRGGNSSFGNLVLARGGESYAGSTNSSGEVLFPTATQPKNLQLQSSYSATSFYAGGGNGTASRVAYGNGVYVYTPGLVSTTNSTQSYLTSTDGFQTRTVRTLPESGWFWHIFFVNGTFWLFNNTGFWTSTDGYSWGGKTSHGLSVTYNRAYSFAYANGWFIFTNGSTTVSRSQNGSTWSSVTAPVAVYWAKAANNVLFGMNTDNNSSSLQYSSDGGATWKYTTTTYYVEDVAYFNGYYHIAHHWSSSINYVYTMDGSGNLSLYTSYSTGSYGGQITADASAGIMYRTDNGTLYSSTDGFNWASVTTGVLNQSTTNRSLDMWAGNGFLIMNESGSTTQNMQAFQFAFGLNGFLGRNQYVGGGSVSPGQTIYSYNNSGYYWGTDAIQNDPYLIGCGLGGQYVVSGSTYDRYAFNVYRTPRYGSGGYSQNTNSTSAVAGGNGIVIVRWWA